MIHGYASRLQFSNLNSTEPGTLKSRQEAVPTDTGTYEYDFLGLFNKKGNDTLYGINTMEARKVASKILRSESFKEQVWFH